MQVLGRQSCCFYTVGNTPRRLYKERSITTYQRRALGINPHKRNKLKTCILKRHTQPVTASTNLSEVEADRKFQLFINGRVLCLTFNCLQKQPAQGGWQAPLHTCGNLSQKTLTASRRSSQLEPGKNAKADKSQL